MFFFPVEDGFPFIALSSQGKLHVERHVKKGLFFLSECGVVGWVQSLEVSGPHVLDFVTGVR